jgi:hypothetical protein
MCPAGKRMRLKSGRFQTGPNGYRGQSYVAKANDCEVCDLKARCIRNPGTKARQVSKLEKGIRDEQQSYTQRMIERFDSPRGQFFYSRRMGTVEPVFAHMRRTLGMDRFTLRGRAKVDIQWKLYCMVHNIAKIQRYAPV